MRTHTTETLTPRCAVSETDRRAFRRCTRTAGHTGACRFGGWSLNDPNWSTETRPPASADRQTDLRQRAALIAAAPELRDTLAAVLRWIDVDETEGIGPIALHRRAVALLARLDV